MFSMFKQFHLVVLMVALSVSLPIEAGEGQVRLGHFLSGLKTLQADFIQSLVDANDKVLEESRGVLLLSRPGRFRLEYYTPYEQLYVADGERVWMYDKDLEQVTVKKQAATLASTPASLLSGTAPVEDNFGIEELGMHEGFQWLELKPKAEDSGFEYMRLALEGDVLRAMEMVDSFGQTTRLYFTEIERNPMLSESKFIFVPPPGVDVIGDTPAK